MDGPPTDAAATPGATAGTAGGGSPAGAGAAATGTPGTAATPPSVGGGLPRSRLLTSPVMLLAGLGRIARDHLDTRLAAEGLSLRHLSVLGHLRHTPGLSYSELARRAGVTAQSMQATVAQLEADGRVVRDTPPGRGRAAQLRVTASGSAALGRAEAIVAELEDTLLATLSPAERAALTRLLLPATMAAMGINPPRRGANPPVGTGPPGNSPPSRRRAE